MNRAGSSIVAIAAGILVALSPVLEWIRLNSSGVAFPQGGVDGSASGMETGLFGWTAVALGAVLIVGGATSGLKVGQGIGAAAVLVSAAIAVALAAFVFTTLESRFVDYAIREAASADLPELNIRTTLGTLFEDGSISVRPGIGLILLGVGGAVGILVGVLGWRRTIAVKAARGQVATPPMPAARRPAERDKFGF
jgi:hypothetical protein